MAEKEYGKCEICGKEGPLQRTYFRYPDIKCECHHPYHFDLVIHCDECIPTQPEYTKISVRTAYLKEVEDVVRCGECGLRKTVKYFDATFDVCCRSGFSCNETDYCSWGIKRKENE